MKEGQTFDSQKRARTSFTSAVLFLSKQFYLSVLVDNPGTFGTVGEALRRSVPALDFVTNGDLASVRDLKAGELENRIAALPIAQIQSEQNALVDLLNISNAGITFRTAQRLRPYLPVTLPGTREGFRVLKEITQQVSKNTDSDSGKNGKKLTENLSSLEQALRVLEDDLISQIMLDSRLTSEIQEIAGSEARSQLFEANQWEDQRLISDLKREIAQRKIAQLRDTKVVEVVDGQEREFSQLDTELYRIIERDNLAERHPEARDQLIQRIEQAKREVVEIITKRRVVRKIAGLILSDGNLRLLAATVSNKTPAEISALTDERGMVIRSQIADQIISAPRKKLFRLGVTVFPDFNYLFAEERDRLTQAVESGDPFLFVAQLDPKEFELIGNRIPNIFRRKMSAVNKALFTLAKTEFQKQLVNGIGGDELIELLTEKIFRVLMRKFVQNMIDRAVQSLDIDFQKLIADPLMLFNLADEIISAALKDEGAKILLSLQASNLFLDENDDQAELTEPAKINPAYLQPRTTGELDLVLENLRIDPRQKTLGPTILRTDIHSSEGPFQYLPDYKTEYPQVVSEALAQLYAEYNLAFAPLVEANREWDTDYQFCLTGPGSSPVNYFVQIDMTGLPDDYLRTATNLEVSQVSEDLRGRIFEIENSLAMYQLLMRINSTDGNASNFELRFRNSLEALRQLHDRPIALLAVTEGKYQLMRKSEFGKRDGDSLTDEEVKQLSGFDKFFGPEEFTKYLSENRGNCGYLLYVRSSDPVSKLKDPGTAVLQPLLSEPDIRRIIKAHSITINIDNPDLPIGSPRRVNDTKAYLIPMGMAFPVKTYADLKSPGFVAYLKSRGVSSDLIESGKVEVRAKPKLNSYGCYGHLRGNFTDGKFVQKLKQGILKRGPYVLQPEMSNSEIINLTDGKSYLYIDRNFYSLIGGNPVFLGGERTLMPKNSSEAVRGRIHGNASSITAEVF